MSENLYRLPVIPLKGLTILPGTTVHFDIRRKSSVTAAQQAMIKGRELFVVTQKNSMEDTPGLDGVYKIGTIVTIKQLSKLPGHIVRVMVEAVAGAELKEFYKNGKFLEAEITQRVLRTQPLNDIEEEAAVRELKDMIKTYESVTHELPETAFKNLMDITELESLMLQILMRMNVSYSVKQQYLEANTFMERFAVVAGFLNRENEIGNIRSDIARKVKEHLDKIQKEHILREQIQVLYEELGEDGMSDVQEIQQKIERLHANDNVKKKLFKELERYRTLHGNIVESNIAKTYIDTMLDMPWNRITMENMDLNRAREILDRDHYKLTKVKERILEFLAVRILAGVDGNNPIICLVGPPGTGKTSIARSVAEALNKPYVRICLGGVDDESEIRGHRKTYVGAMPGRIAMALKQAGKANPLILFDEIDKLGRGIHGDPAAALLEVMDSEQNSAFRDNYLEVPIDLSQVLFIATANDLSTIPTPLIDRMEIIPIEGYTDNEKFHIAKDHLLKKEYSKHGIKKSQLVIADEAIYSIIRFYTREAGVRQLDREIAGICRKAAGKIVTEGKKKLRVTANNIEKYLGKKKYDTEFANEHNDIGIVRGLAWTAVGGTTLQVEVNTMPGKGRLKLTGKLGDTMKESAQIAFSYVRSIAADYDVKESFFATHDLHIHVPEGAVPKDGPSAGITMATAILSAVAEIPVDCNVAMTGEINLRGAVLPIGGLKEKLLAAKNAGMKIVLVPEKNKKDIEEIDEEIISGIKIVFVGQMNRVLDGALVR